MGRKITREIEILVAVTLIIAGVGRAEGDTIHALQQLFRISWTSSSLNITCHVEQASSPAGPWGSLESIYVTSPSNHTDSAMANSSMFFRVVCEKPDPHFADIMVEQSLELLRHRQSDNQFVIIDIRRDYEYNSLHIINSLNIDYYASSFQTQLNALDKNKAYLIYCRTGSRSGNTMPIMQSLGFKEVYNMLGGITEFDDVPGVDVFLEP